MMLHNRAGHNADVVLFGQGAVFLQVGFPLRADVDEPRVLRNPIGQMVFRQYGELRAVRGGAGDEIRGLLVVSGDLHRLKERRES